MTRATAPPILAQLHSSHSVSEQVAVLRLLKNDLIGHDQRKEAYVAGGILPALAQVLAVCWPGKAAAAGSNGAASGQSGFLQSSEETEACQQAILIVGSLAQGIHNPRLVCGPRTNLFDQVAHHSSHRSSPAMSFLGF